MMTQGACSECNPKETGGIALLDHRLRMMKAWQVLHVYLVTWHPLVQQRQKRGYRVPWEWKMEHQKRDQLVLQRNGYLIPHHHSPAKPRWHSGPPKVDTRSFADNELNGGLFFAILGGVLFIPGFYYTRIAYYAYKGYKGFTFADIPPV